MSTRADDEASADELRRYAFHMEPQLERAGIVDSGVSGRRLGGLGPKPRRSAARLGEESLGARTPVKTRLPTPKPSTAGTCVSLWQVFMPSTTSSTASWCTHPRPSVNAQ